MSLLDPESELIDKITTKELIIEWLEKYDIENYNINDDFTIDVNEDVYLILYPESQLPDYIQFGQVNGWFNIAYSKIEALKGCPKIVNGWFNCSGSKNLKSLKNAPDIIKNGFYCYYCSNLKITKSDYKKYNIIK